VFMSTATDPYQPAEEHYQITRRMLKVFERYPQHALFILTKQALVERDAEILGRLPRVAVGMSISVIEDRLARLIEPWAPLTSERLAIIERLSGRGIPTYILWAPVIVPMRLSGEWIENSLATIARTGTGALSLDTLNYRSGQPAGLFRRLKREGHAAATRAQIEQIRKAADAQGLGRRLEVVKPAAVEEIAPLLPF
jgi:DNA repair photolyase